MAPGGCGEYDASDDEAVRTADPADTFRDKKKP